MEYFPPRIFLFATQIQNLRQCRSDVDRAALTINDIGVNIRKNAQGDIGYRIYVGGGLGRTPMVGEVINDFVPEEDLITYLASIMRVYNQFGTPRQQIQIAH